MAPPKLLWIAAASNEAINAAYVRTLAGLTAAEAGTLVDSPLNIYYAADLNPDMLDQTVPLESGGHFIPVGTAPPTGTILIIR